MSKTGKNSNDSKRDIYIIGVRGIPNRYGGFERLVEILAPHLVDIGYNVTVFCERDASSPVADDYWHGVRRCFVSVRGNGPLGTIEYDWRSFKAVPAGSVALIFGYGTGLFQRYLKRRGIAHAVNMDGIEWKRQKWGRLARIWLRFNERQAVGLANELVADHPEIQSYLQRELRANSTMIAYGVDNDALQLLPGQTPAHPLLEHYPDQSFFLIVARPEPENQIHLLLDAYARSSKRLPLVVLGHFESNDYGRQLLARHANEVHFAGGVYDTRVLNELRRRSAYYLHGHSVGGTNPSLIEAMAAGAVVIAHDNPFNRWVMGSTKGDQNDRRVGGLFFHTTEDLLALLDQPVSAFTRSVLISTARARCIYQFTWNKILADYESLVMRLHLHMGG